MIEFKIKQKTIDLSTPIIMGILNLTPNSFYDGGKYDSEKKIIIQTKKMLNEGASIIDIGANSSKPGSHPISAKKEIKRLIPIIKKLTQEFPGIIISIDTFRSEVARVCIDHGADMINDISAGDLDKDMFNTIAELQVPYVLMHMQKNPYTMQDHPYYKDVTKEITICFKQKIIELKKLGANNLIVDPGFGFGKTINHNYQIMNNLTSFKKLELPILIGVSRKSMIYNLLGIHPNMSLNGTTVLHTLSLLMGVNILRVHDVKEAIECIKIINFVNKKK